MSRGTAGFEGAGATGASTTRASGVYAREAQLDVAAELVRTF